MGRIYEDRATLRQEDSIAKVLEGKWRCELYKAPISYFCDYFAVHNKKIKSMIELKGHPLSYDFVISKCIQAASAFQISQTLGVPYIQVHYDEKKRLILYKVLKKEHFSKAEIVHTKNNDGRVLKDGEFPYYDFILKIPKQDFLRIEY